MKYVLGNWDFFNFLTFVSSVRLAFLSSYIQNRQYLIKFVHLFRGAYDLERQSQNYKNNVNISEAFFEPNQTSKMQLFTKTIFAKSFILDV